MRYATKLSVLAVTLCGLTLVASGFAIWGARDSQWILVRSDLAHRTYEAYLELMGQVQAWQSPEIVRLEDPALPATLDEGESLKAAVRDLRTLHEAEYEWVGDKEAGELAGLAHLKSTLDAFIAETREKAYARSVGDASGTLVSSSGPQLVALITAALARESLELEEARRQAQTATSQRQWLALAWAGLALLGAIIAWRWMVRDFRAPVARLIKEADRLARGEWQEPVAISSDTELDRVALAFNHMATEIRVRQARLEASNEALGVAVAERTAELEDLLQSLRQSEAGRRELLADVSHELRTPLTIIRGEADVALRGGDKPVIEYRDALKRTREAAIHMARLVDDLLLIARHESHELVLQMATCDLAELLRTTVEASRSVLGSLSVDIRIESVAIPALAHADALRLRQVLLILLDNAARHGGRHAQVSLTPEDSTWCLTVRDDGPGLAPAELARVFQRFYRGGDAASRYAAGAGLGLPVAKAIVEAHAGTLALESGPAQGVRATLTLPRVTGDNSAA